MHCVHFHSTTHRFTLLICLVMMGLSHLIHADSSVVFTWKDSSAKFVFVVGDFNEWNTTATPLQKDSSGLWTTPVSLKEGDHSYKFLVDGDWKLDPINPKQADDGTGIVNSILTVAKESASDLVSPKAPEVSAPQASSAELRLAGQVLAQGSETLLEIVITDNKIEKILRQSYGKSSNKAQMLLAVPTGFQPLKKDNRLLIVSATTDVGGSSIGAAREYLKDALAAGYVVLAVDGEFGRPEGNGDSTDFRWALVSAALQEMQKEWPTSKEWPVATAGISGGAGYASHQAIMLVQKRYLVIGLFLATTGWNPTHFRSELGRAPSGPMHRVPIFMSVGDSDTIATSAITKEALQAVKKEGFKQVRYEVFAGGHKLNRAHLQAALQWFGELDKKPKS